MNINLKNIVIAFTSIIPYSVSLTRSSNSLSSSLASRYYHHSHNNNNIKLTTLLKSQKIETSTTDPNMVTVRTALDEAGSKGEFVRRDAAWRNWVKQGMKKKKTYFFLFNLFFFLSLFALLYCDLSYVFFCFY